MNENENLSGAFGEDVVDLVNGYLERGCSITELIGAMVLVQHFLLSDDIRKGEGVANDEKAQH